MLCDYCSAIFIGHREYGRSYKQLSLTDLRQSAKDGCRLCTLISDYYTECNFGPWSIGRNPPFWFFLDTDHGTRNLRLSFMVPFSPVAKFLLFAPRGNPNLPRLSQDVVQFHQHRRLPTNTGSALCKTLAKQLIEHCLQNHAHCKRFVSEGWVPTRLVNVTTSPPRLVKGSAIPSQTAYATLSHRWKRDLVKLTTDKLKAFEDAIPVQELSRTFLDAFEMARALGISYVWIDCLCIIQDSNEDWETESAAMGRIYKHGFCNFVATAAADGPDGLFVDRKQSWRTPFQVRTAWTAPSAGIQPLKNGSYAFVDSEHPSYDEEKALGRRGWVFQEQVLSPRTISFGNQLHWECEAVACEMYPEFDGFVPVNSGRQTYKSHIRETRTLSNWLEVVQKYGSCRLTYDEDKLIAFSGIAKEFHLKAEYLAGLWRDDLTWQLLWHTNGPGARTKSYCAPSWSWASVNTEDLSYPSYSVRARQDVARVIASETTPVQKHEPFGQIADGYIKLQGLLHEVTLFHEDSGRIKMHPPASQGRLLLSEEFMLDDSDHPWKPYYVLPITVMSTDPDQNMINGYLVVLGLILELARSTQYYNRCGYFEVRINHFSSSPSVPHLKWLKFLQEWRSYLPGDPPLESHERLGLERTDSDNEVILTIK